MSRRFWKTADTAPPLDQPERLIPRDFLGGSSPSGSTTTVQKSDPWSGVSPYLSDIFQRADSLSLNPNTIAPQSAATKQAIQQQISDSTNPNGLVSQAQGAIKPYLSGDFLSMDHNPAIQAAVDAARRTVNTQFSGDNYGGSANREWLTKAATQAAAPMFTDQQNKQMAAISAAPGLQVANTNLLANAGNTQDIRSQTELMAPWDVLSRYLSAVSGQPGGTASNTNPYFTNAPANALGLGLGGLSLYNGMKQGGLLGGGGTSSFDYTGYDIGGGAAYG
jgi:hypothetical protein